MIAHVLYKTSDDLYYENNSKTDFNCFEIEYSGTLMLADLIESFPLGKSYQLDVRNSSGLYIAYQNPLSRVQIFDGVVYVRAVPLAEAPVSTLEHYTANSVEGVRSGYESKNERLQMNLRNNVSNAASGLMKMVGNAANWATEQFSEEILVGDRKVAKVKEMAEGGFSKVFLVKDTERRQDYALKEIICQDFDSIKMAEKEIEVLKSVSHECVVSLVAHDCYLSKEKNRIFRLLFPFVNRGTAWDCIMAASKGETAWPFHENYSIKLFLDACYGTQALHSSNWAHRDIKPMNILIGRNGRGILMDLGSAAPLVREVSNRQDAASLEDEASVVCSAPYRPPELIHINPGMVLDGRVDVWALACTLFSFGFGRSPFESPREGVLKLGIINGRFDFPRANRNALGCSYSQSFCDSIKWMLNPDHKSRPHLSEVIERFEHGLR